MAYKYVFAYLSFNENCHFMIVHLQSLKHKRMVLTERGRGNLSQWSLPHIGWLIVRRKCATKPNHTTATDEIAHLL